MAFSRRTLFRIVGGAFLPATSYFGTPAFANLIDSEVRSLAFDNLHTGERLKLDYWVHGAYVPDALASINHVLRDFRTGDVRAIEPKLLDLLVAIRQVLDTTAPYAVISGYRSPNTNAQLHEASSGVASQSLHMKGMAIDIRVPGRSLAVVHKTALAMRAGGVGYYPKSDFVHVDVGRVRRW